MTRSQTAIGIDFGASFSTAAVYEGSRLIFAVDQRGEACIPTAVYFPRRGAPIVGLDALNYRVRDPANTIICFKRLLGCGYDSEERRFVDGVTALRVKKGSGDSVAIKTAQGDRTPVELASLVVRSLKEKVEKRLGRKVDRAVMTAPARASVKAREATAMAGRMAGFSEIEMIPEPCAAALSFGLKKDYSGRKFLVYDFGGGTFDSTLIEQNKDVFEVFGSDGDACLGGDNFDEELAKMIAGQIWHQTGIDVTKDRLLWDETVRRSELAKRALSTHSETTVKFRDTGSTVRIDGFSASIERESVDEVWQSLVQRSLERSARTVIKVGARPKDLTGVMMVGGTTYVPLVRERVQQVFDIPCAFREDAQTAVASGAAVFAAGRFKLSSEGWATDG